MLSFWAFVTSDKLTYIPCSLQLGSAFLPPSRNALKSSLHKVIIYSCNKTTLVVTQLSKGKDESFGA